MSHISISTPSGTLSLPADFSLDIEEQNPMFNDTDIYSLPVQIPKSGNLHLLKNMFARQSPLRPISLEDTQMEIIADGIPFRFCHISTSDGEEMTDSISVNMEGNSALRDLIADMSLKDIAVDDNILIGKKISEIEIGAKFNAHMKFGKKGKENLDLEIQIPETDRNGNSLREDICKFNPQALGFSHQMNINVSKPYPEMPYCNARVAYKRYGIETDEDGNRSTSDSVEYGIYGPYEVLDADRQQSGICYYVLYILRKAFEQLGLDYDDTELLAIEDMRRLCFFTTKCTYDEGEMVARFTINDQNTDIIKEINEYIALELDMNTQESLELALRGGEEEEVQSLTIPDGSKVTYSLGRGEILEPEQYKPFYTVYKEDNLKDAIVVGDTHIGGGQGAITLRLVHPAAWTMPYSQAIPAGTQLRLKVSEGSYMRLWVTDRKVTSGKVVVSNMYANSQCLPDESLSTVIESMEAQFGVRFLYDAETRKVRATLLRNMYRDHQPPVDFVGTITEMNKIAEKIKGVKIGYGSESDDKQQRDNLRDSVKDYDLDYDYMDYPLPVDAGGKRGMPGVVKACETIVGENMYRDCILRGANNVDNVCYIDSTTGNAYRVKIDSDFTSVQDMHPAFFEAGAFRGVRLGDCSDEDTTEVITSSFIPLALNDVNADKVRAYADNEEESKKPENQPLLCPFVDEDMEHPYLPQYLDYPFNRITYADITIRCKLTLHEAYDTSKSDDGNSPLQSADWGLAIAVMRGGGSDATTQVYDDNYDGFGTAKFAQVVGTYALTSDCMDAMGNYYDYNGSDGGLGGGERFSLKPRAYKTPEWAPDGQYFTLDGMPVQLIAPDAWKDGEIVLYSRTRGWVDRFMMEHIRSIMDRRKFVVRGVTTTAFIANIPNLWARRFNFLGEICYINKINYTLSAAHGLTNVEIEVFAV